MKKILGLDLGTTSIGWAIINENEENTSSEILGMGSRIIPLSVDDKNEFTSGNAISKNQTRTKNRTQRKGYDRYQLRRKYLIAALHEAKILPDLDLIHLNKLNLWELRSKAIVSELTPQELGRVFLHLNQKRGYKSSRSDANLDKKDTEYVANVKSRHEAIKELNLTIGQYFYKQLKDDETFRTKEKIFPREAYIEEFDAICKQQKQFHSSILTPEFIQTLRNEIIYYQRPLKSQKGLVSVCDFEGFWIKTTNNKELFVGPKVAPKSSPLFQICTLWETINNINLKDRKGQPVIIPFNKKQEIFNYLDTNEKLSYAELLKIINLKRDDVYGNKQLINGLKGNSTKYQILKCFENIDSNNPLFALNLTIIDITTNIVDKETGEIIGENTTKVVGNKIENEPLYRLWHVIYSIHNQEECTKVLYEKFNIDLESATKLAALDFTKQAFSNKSVKAIRKILPYLMEGDVYSIACEKAGYNHSNSLTKEENEKRKLLDKLKPIEKNSLRQPIVEKILNQMVNVVNAIIDQYGKPDEIRVELARELKQSKDERNETDKAMRRIEKENIEIRKQLEGYGVRASRNNIIKWRLYHEIENEDKKLNAICIYCGQPISLTSALKGAEIDIEHIIPKTRLFDDSQSNKTLAHRKCNATKKNLTAYDFMSQKSDNEFEAYIERVNLLFKNGLIKKAKRDKLLMAGDKIPDDFIERQLRETQYIARKSREILQSICRNVWATSGTVTAELRHIWGWDDVLMNLQLPKYRDLGLTEIEVFEHKGQTHSREKVIGWSKRDDHRHHAIDALTIACTKQGFIQRLNTLNASKTREEMYKVVNEDSLQNEEISENKTSTYNEEKRKLYEDYLYKMMPFSTREVEEKVSQILISFKAGKKVASKGIRKIKKNGKKIVVQSEGIIVPRGALSEASVYGQIKATEKKPVKYLFENPHLIVKPNIKQLVEERLVQYNQDSKLALASLKKDPIKLSDDVELTFGTCFKNEYVIKYPIQSIKTKDLESVVDTKVRSILENRLSQFNNKEKEAFKDLENNPVWFNEEKKIEIKTVRCFTGLSSVEPLVIDKNGTSIGFVKPGNNHHIAIYTDAEGKKQEHVCTFWHAVERKKYGIPVIIENPEQLWDSIAQLPENTFSQTFLEKLPAVNWKLELSMQQNEMFLLGLPRVEAESAINNGEFDFISKYLYRMQKMSIKGNGQIDLWFRHHLETILNDDNSSKTAKRFYNIQSLGALYQLTPIKVRVNTLGQINII